MNIEIFQVPYDSGHFCERTGRGPDYFLGNGVVGILQEDGHSVNLHRIESKAELNTEIGTAFELNRILAQQLQSLPDKGFPLVLSGNCNSSVGALAGIGSEEMGIIWFDAHGDYNTPETTISGFLDGMGLAMAAGQCWQELLKQMPGYRPVPPSNVIHVGALDLDPEEQKMFERDGIPVITKNLKDENAFFKLLAEALYQLRSRVKSVYVHIDMDVLETEKGKANQLALPGGLSVGTVVDSLAIIKEKLEIRACGIASCDPAFDEGKGVLNAGLRIIRAIFE